jgi:signal transduction histidine kinase
MIFPRPQFKLRLKQLGWRSLQTKLAITFVAIALVPLLLLAGLTQHLTRQSLKAAAYQNLAATATQTGRSIDAFITGNLDSIRSAALQPDMAEYLTLSDEGRLDARQEAHETHIQQNFQALIRRSGLNIMFYMLLDRQGRVITDSKLKLIGQDFSNQDFFRVAMARDLPYVSPVQFIPAPSPTPVLYFSSAVRNVQGLVLGTLVVCHNASAIQQLIQQNDQLAGKGSFAILLDEYTVRLAHGNAPDLVFSSVVPLPLEQRQRLQQLHRLPQGADILPTTQLPELAAALKATTCAPQKICSSVHEGIPLAVTIQRETGQSAVVSGVARSQDLFAVAMTTLKTQPWFVVYAMPRDVLLGPVNAQLRLILLLAGVLAIAMALLALVLGQRFAQPILDLTHQVAQFTAGDLQARVQRRIHHRDEIGILAQSFNTMAEQVGNLLQERTQQLQAVGAAEVQARQKAEELEQTLHTLQQTQAHLIQSEKMSSLGQMVAGVAHEINNPVSFIHGNLAHAQEYADRLIALVHLYQTDYPHPRLQIQQALEEADVDFIQQDLPKLLQSMQTGTERIREIVLSLRNFSRLDESELKKVDLHDGLDSTLVILGSRLKATTVRQGGQEFYRPAIDVVTQYDALPLVECYPGELNQVVLNIITNAIDALEVQCDQDADFAPQIVIATQALESNWVELWIGNNGPLIPAAVRDRLFDPFFTTKPIGQGTGMGLAIAYQIITEKHGGQLECQSTPDAGTRFIIRLPVHGRR